MIVKLDDIPRWSQVEEVYGNPDKDGDDEIDLDWYETRTTWYKLPYTMVAPWDKNRMYHRIRVHRLVGPAMIDALREIGDHFGPSILKGDLNVLGGTLCLRPMKSSVYLSMHAYGIAIDVNNHTACWGCDPDTQDPFIVEAFKVRGFVWGGDWDPPYKDPMHFQACGG